MSTTLQQINGALGYVESSHVHGHLQAAALQNASGGYAKPTNKAASEPLASVELGHDLTGIDPNPKAGYLLVTFTWILLYKRVYGDKLDGAKETFGYILSDEAQAIAPELGFVSLPPNVLSKARAALGNIVD